jgi:type III secretory pathway component EscS
MRILRADLWLILLLSMPPLLASLAVHQLLQALTQVRNRRSPRAQIIATMPALIISELDVE